MILNVGLAVRSLNGIQKLTEAAEVQTQLLTLSDVEDENFFQTTLDLIVWQPEFSACLFPAGFKKFLSENPHARLVIYNIKDASFQLPAVAKERVLLTLHNPLNKESVKSILKNTLQYKIQSAEQLLDTLVEEPTPMMQIIGKSKAVKKMREFIDLISKSPFTPCLIQGERGTEKQDIARMIHANGKNNTSPIRFITCRYNNSEDLLEKLFGVASSNRNQPGIIELSNGGTIVLDDIELIHEEIQKRLQVFLETNLLRRKGAASDVQVKARMIATTDYDLEKFVLNERFSRELYFRLKAFELSIPPLRSRSDDLAQLIPYYINVYNSVYGHRVKNITESVSESLNKYTWPGNLSELKLVLEHAVLLTKSGYITPEVMPACIMNQNPHNYTTDFIGNCSLRDLERLHIEKVLLRTKGNKSRAAQILNISRTTLREKLRHFDLDQVYQME
jgi:two-component system response regulator HydG